VPRKLKERQRSENRRGRQELKERQRSSVCPSFFSVGGTRRSTLLGGKRRTNGSNRGEHIKKRKEKVAGRGKHDARLSCVVQVKKKGGGNPLI